MARKQSSKGDETPKKRWMIQTSAAAGKDFDAVVNRLVKAGLKIHDRTEDLMADAGIVFGEAHSEAYEKLAAVPDVVAIEEQRDYQLPPPGSSVQ